MEGVISESKYLLDDSNAAKDQADAVKRQLKGLLRPGNDIQEWMLAQMAWPANLPQPYVILQDIASIMGRMQRVMRENWVVMDVDSIQRRWCCFESPHLFRERWEKMFRNFVSTTDEESDEAEVRRSMHPESYPDPSWIPALYDSLKYDALHNRQFLQTIFSNEEDEVSVRTSSDASTPVLGRCGSDLRELYRKVKIMFDFIATQEFGISDTEKKNIGMLISFPLLKSILSDLDEMKSADNARTRLYFTKGKTKRMFFLLSLLKHLFPLFLFFFFLYRVTCTCLIESGLSIGRANQGA
jgi:hypothetical protein